MSLFPTYSDAMEMTTQAAADEYLAALIDSCCKRGATKKRATRIVKANLGYVAGYYSDEVRERVERLYKTKHPFFGAIAEKGPPTPEQAFEMGKRFGEKIRKAKLRKAKAKASGFGVPFVGDEFRKP